MFSESAQLWYCDNVVGASWQFGLLILPLVGAFLYGRGKHKVAWTLISVWIVIHLSLSALTNLVFSCTME